MAHTRIWGWVATAVVAAVAGVGIWVGMRPDAAPESAQDPTPAASTSATTSPSVSPAPGTAGPSPAAYSLTTMTRPVIDKVLPRALPSTSIDTLEGLPGTVAVPRSPRIPAWASPDTTRTPVLALESEYYEAHARWLVLERRAAWVKVLVPYGRGALPSQDPERVNGTAAWVRTEDVRLVREQRALRVDLSERTVTLTRADGSTQSFAAAVGAPESPTPVGLTQVFTVTEAVNTGLSVFLSMQSESLDGFYGTEYAATALHVGDGQGQAVSNGCIRLADADLKALTPLDPGVPVLVTP